MRPLVYDKEIDDHLWRHIFQLLKTTPLCGTNAATMIRMLDEGKLKLATIDIPGKGTISVDRRDDWMLYAINGKIFEVWWAYCPRRIAEYFPYFMDFVRYKQCAKVRFLSKLPSRIWTRLGADYLWSVYEIDVGEAESL